MIHGANQCFDRIAVPLMPATDAVGPPMRGGPTLRRVTPVPLIAPRFAPGGVTIGLAIGWLGTSGLASGRAETFPGPSGVVAEGRWGTAVGKCVPSRGCAGAGTATPIELRTGVCGGGDSRRVSAGTPGARDCFRQAYSSCPKHGARARHGYWYRRRLFRSGPMGRHPSPVRSPRPNRPADFCRRRPTKDEPRPSPPHWLLPRPLLSKTRDRRPRPAQPNSCHRRAQRRMLLQHMRRQPRA
jgi:hypothetical protein